MRPVSVFSDVNASGSRFCREWNRRMLCKEQEQSCVRFHRQGISGCRVSTWAVWRVQGSGPWFPSNTFLPGFCFPPIDPFHAASRPSLHHRSYAFFFFLNSFLFIRRPPTGKKALGNYCMSPCRLRSAYSDVSSGVHNREACTKAVYSTLENNGIPT